MEDSKQILSGSSSDDEQLDKNMEFLKIIKDKKIKSADEKKKKIDDALANGANINFKDLNSYKRTALYYAVKNGEKEIVDHLLLKGARVTAEDKKANPLKDGEKLKQKALSGSAEEQNYIEIIVALKTKISRNNPQPSTSQSQTSKTSTSIFIDEGSKQRKRKLSDSLEDVFSKKLKDDLPVKSETYAASGLKSTLHGVSYQLKLLMLYAKRCHSANIQYKLATEMDDAERFDDLVLEYINPDDKTKHGIFLQAKHIQTEYEDGRKIKANDLLTTSEGKFSLQKYFRSYQNIKKNDKFKEQSQKCFIIYTNIDFAFDDESNVLNTPLKKLNSLYFEPISTRIAPFNVEINYGVKKSQLYKLVGPKHKAERKEVIDKLTTLFEKTTDFYNLANELAEYLIYKKTISFNTPLFKIYHGPLVKEVIDINNNKLRKEFITLNSKISSGAKEFREVLFTYFGKMLKAKSKHEQSASEKELLQIIGKTIDHRKKKPKLDSDNFLHFWNKVGDILLEISVKFKKKLILDKNPTLDNPEKYADGIFCLIKNRYVKNIEMSETNSKSETSSISLKMFISKTDPLIDEIYKLAGHILVKDAQRVVTFSSNFLNNNNQLVGNLEDFRTKLKNKLKEYNKINFDELKNCTFQIMNFVTCKENEFADRLANDTAFFSSNINQDEIEGFMNDLIFAVNQPNENALGKIINKEIGESFNLENSELLTHDFEKRMLVWFSEKAGRYLKNEEINAYFNNINEKISQFILIGPTSEYIYKLKKTGIVFKYNALTKLLAGFLKQSNGNSQISYKICHLDTANTSPLLGSVKVNQTLKDTEEDYSRADSFISIYLNTLLSIPDFVLKAFKKEGARLLIIECNSKEKIDYKILNELKIYLDNSNQKRLLLIGPADNDLIEKLCNDHSESQLKIEDESHFNDLTQTSQEHLLNRKYKFQEHEVVLNQLFEKTETNITNSLILAELLDNEKIFKIGNPIPSFVGYDENYFVKRTFWHGLEKNPNEPQKHVKVEKMLDDLFEQQKQNTQKNNIIISGVAGMGKSTILTHLSHEIKKQSKDCWIEKIELSKHTDALNECTSFTEESAIDFISNNILKIQIPFERELFKHLFHKKKVVLLLDGFDEICPNYENTVLNLLDALKNSENQLWVTTRPDLKESLRNKLKDRVAFYNLEPFVLDDKITFLTKFWSEKLKCDKKTIAFKLDAIKIEKYAKELLKNLKKSIKNNEFTGIPLQTRMLAEAFETEFITFYNDLNQNAPTFLKEFDILDLYVKFYKAKYDFVSQKGIVVQDDTHAIINEYGLNDVYSNLALLALFPKQKDFLTIDKQKLLSLKIARFGIAETFDCKEIKFIHPTYAEYSVADFFSKALINNKPTEACKYFLTNILLDDNCKIIRYFIDCFLKITSISEVYSKQYGEQIDKLWNDKTHKEKDIKTILNTAAREGNAHVVQFLSESLKDNYKNTLKSLLEARDKNETAWTQAASNNHFVVLKKLWQWTVDLKLNLEFKKNLMLSTDSLNERNAFHFAAANKGIEALGAIKSWATEIQLDFKNDLLVSKDKNGQTVFHLAAKEGYVGVLQMLLNWHRKTEFDLQNELLLIKDNNGKTAFHIATQFGNVEVVKIIRDWTMGTKFDLQKQLLLTKDENGRTAFHIAIQFGYVDVVEILRDWAMETDWELQKDLLMSKNDNKTTAFHLAADAGCIKVLQMLRNWATEIECDFKNDFLLFKDNNGQTTFHLAAVKGHVEVLKIIKDWSTELDSDFEYNLLLPKDNNGQTSFHLAASKGHVEVLTILKDWTTQPDSDIKKNLLFSKDNNGQTAFHLAAMQGHVEVLKKLRDWVTELDSDFEDNLLLSKDDNEKSSFHLAAEGGHVEILKILRVWATEIECDFKKDVLLSKDNKGQTLLHLSAAKGRIKVLTIIQDWATESKCDFRSDLLSLKDNDGKTAIRIASESSHAKLAEMLKL